MHSRCKECEKAAKKPEDRLAWEHVESIVYEIGKLELEARTERANRNKKIIQVKEQADFLIDKITKQQARLFETLDGFVQERFTEADLLV